MEVGKKKLIMIAIILFTGTTLAVGAQQGWFTFILVPDLPGTDLEFHEDFILTGAVGSQDLFQVSVIMSGSGNTGQEQQVSITIEHNRMDGGYWEADGFYVLALEEMDGSPVDTIDSGAFTDLREYESYVKPLTWIPSAEPKLYMMNLRIYDVIWDLVVEYTITATAGTGGSITPSGAIPVLEGGPQGFIITPDAGYAIDDVLVDGVSVGLVSDYLFEGVTADHTIEASFAQSIITMRSHFENGTLAFVDDTSYLGAFDPIFNGSAVMQYIAGVETVNCSWMVIYSEHGTETITSITYSLDYMYLNGTIPVNVVSHNTVNCSIARDEEYAFIDLFTAPSIPNEDYTVLLHIESVTT